MKSYKAGGGVVVFLLSLSLSQITFAEIPYIPCLNLFSNSSKPESLWNCTGITQTKPGTSSGTLSSNPSPDRYYSQLKLDGMTFSYILELPSGHTAVKEYSAKNHGKLIEIFRRISYLVDQDRPGALASDSKVDPSSILIDGVSFVSENKDRSGLLKIRGSSSLYPKHTEDLALWVYLNTAVAPSLSQLPFTDENVPENCSRPADGDEYEWLPQSNIPCTNTEPGCDQTVKKNPTFYYSTDGAMYVKVANVPWDYNLASVTADGDVWSGREYHKKLRQTTKFQTVNDLIGVTVAFTQPQQKPAPQFDGKILGVRMELSSGLTIFIDSSEIKTAKLGNCSYSYYVFPSSLAQFERLLRRDFPESPID